MLLMLDNYDSFTWNLVQYLGELGEEVHTIRNDAMSVAELMDLGATRLVVSPGPRTPDEAGVSVECIRSMAGQMPILGVCLGHQAIAQVFGGKVVRAPELMHGKTSAVRHGGQGVFAGLPNPLTATRYHSLIAERESLPDCLEVTAWLEDGMVMGLRHRSYPLLQGVQFHPESVLTEAGHQLLANFLASASA